MFTDNGKRFECVMMGKDTSTTDDSGNDHKSGKSPAHPQEIVQDRE